MQAPNESMHQRREGPARVKSISRKSTDTYPQTSSAGPSIRTTADTTRQTADKVQAKKRGPRSPPEARRPQNCPSAKPGASGDGANNSAEGALEFDLAEGPPEVLGRVHPVSGVQPDATRNDISTIERKRRQSRDTHVPGADPWRRAASTLRRPPRPEADKQCRVASRLLLPRGGHVNTRMARATYAPGDAPSVAKEAGNRKSEKEGQVAEGPPEPRYNKLRLPIRDTALQKMRRATTDPQTKSHKGLASGEVAPNEGPAPSDAPPQPEGAGERQRAERENASGQESHPEAHGRASSRSLPGR